jgi:hypothetical protein
VRRPYAVAIVSSAPTGSAQIDLQGRRNSSLGNPIRTLIAVRWVQLIPLQLFDVAA